MFYIIYLLQINKQLAEYIISKYSLKLKITFLEIYNIISIGTQLNNDYYKIAESKKMNILNAFQSIILSLPDNKIIIDKFNRGHARLETILNKYINELYDICNNDIIINGYNINKRPINVGPKEYNIYTDIDKNFTYQFY